MLHVVGSINEDLILTAPRLPGPGETVPADSLSRAGGGKGANLAAAAARLGAPTALIGCVGADAAGDRQLDGLAAAGVDLTAVTRSAAAPTGIAVVLVERGGENRILVVAGANGKLDAAAVATAERRLPQPRLVATNLEVPPRAALAALAAARRAGVPLVLNAAPALDFPLHRLGAADVLVVNAAEAARYAGADEADGAALARRLSERLACRVVVTLGAAGCAVGQADRVDRVAAPRVRAVDTTGAGDAFCGALCARLLEGDELVTAARRAAWAAAFTTTRPGAQSSQPTRQDLRRFATERGAAADDVLP